MEQRIDLLCIHSIDVQSPRMMKPYRISHNLTDFFARIWEGLFGSDPLGYSMKQEAVGRWGCPSSDLFLEHIARLDLVVQSSS